MAVDFGTTNADKYYSAADAAGLTFPNGQFALVWWVRNTENAGGAYRYLISNGGYFATSTINVFLEEASVGDGDEGTWNVAFVDDSDNGPAQLVSGDRGSTFTGGDDWMFVFQRTGAQFELWSCQRGSGDATLQATGSISGVGQSNGGAWNVGRRTDGDSDRYFQGHAGEIACIAGASLSETDIEALAAGTQTIVDAGYSPNAYWSLNDANDTTDDSGNANTLTKHGSPADSGFQFITAAGGLAIAVAAQHYRSMKAA